MLSLLCVYQDYCINKYCSPYCSQMRSNHYQYSTICYAVHTSMLYPCRKLWAHTRRLIYCMWSRVLEGENSIVVCLNMCFNVDTCEPRYRSQFVNAVKCTWLWYSPFRLLHILGQSSSFLSFHQESCPLNCALPMPGTADGDVVSRCQVLGRAGGVHHGADQ